MHIGKKPKICRYALTICPLLDIMHIGKNKKIADVHYEGCDDMAWYDKTALRLEAHRTYSHRALMACLKEDFSTMPDSSLRWAIQGMLKDGRLKKRGYNEYAVNNGQERSEYRPTYSQSALELIGSLDGKYPYISFTVFETMLMNEFLNHLVAQNTVFIQAEKESNIFLFRFLQERGYADLMYRPSGKDFSLYWAKDCIVVTDLVSEAPFLGDEPHSICLEKLLVDMYADKLISTTYSKAEFPDVLHLALSQYRVDEARMLRYARRRNREIELKQLLKEEKENHADA